MDKKLRDSCENAYNNVIMGDEIFVSQNANFHHKALNLLCFGTTGSGKSFGHVKPNILQMNGSYVVTDPSGNLCKETGETLRRNGYRVFIFDINDMKHCNTYNPLKYCKKEADIKIIVDSFIQSTDSTGGKGGNNQDPFWNDSMNAFLCAMISLLCIIPEGSKVPYAQMPEIMGEEILYSPCFSNLTELTRIANKKWTPNCSIPKNAALGDGKNNTANASQVAAIYENIRVWEADRQNCSPEEINKPYTLREWENFCLAPEKTSTTILMTTAVRLDSFNIEQVKNLTSSDNINLYDFGNRKDILFLIIPSNVRTYDFLASFLYTQLFDRLYHRCEYEMDGTTNIFVGKELLRHFSKEEVDAGEDKKYLKLAKKATIVRKEAKGKLKGKIPGKNKKQTKPVSFDDAWYELVAENGEIITRRPTKELIEKYKADLMKSRIELHKGQTLPQVMHIILDEFKNIGKIPGFLEKLATIRKYKIQCTIICQNLSQLKGLYPDDWSTVDGNCPFFLFLGGDDNETTEYVSKKIGQETVRGWNNSIDNKKVNMSYQIEGRELMRPEDIGRIDFQEELLFIYGEQPIFCHKFDYTKHKNYKYTTEYAADLGFMACLFDRTVYKTDAITETTLKPTIATSVPEVKEFDMMEFKRIMRKFSDSEATENLLNNYENCFADEDFM